MSVSALTSSKIRRMVLSSNLRRQATMPLRARMPSSVAIIIPSIILYQSYLTAELSGGAEAWLSDDLSHSPLKNERNCLPRPSAASG
jgi:hypothetical protein